MTLGGQRLLPNARIRTISNTDAMKESFSGKHVARVSLTLFLTLMCDIRTLEAHALHSSMHSHADIK